MAAVESALANLGLDPTKGRAVLDGLPRRLDRAMDKRVGQREAFREALAKTVRDLWIADAMPFEDAARVERTMRTIVSTCMPTVATPRIDYRRLVRMASEMWDKHVEKEKEKTEEKKLKRKKHRGRERDNAPRRTEASRDGREDRSRSRRTPPSDNRRGHEDRAAPSRGSPSRRRGLVWSPYSSYVDVKDVRITVNGESLLHCMTDPS